MGRFSLGSLVLVAAGILLRVSSQKGGCAVLLAGEIGQRSREHLVLIGLCRWMVFILVCHIVSLPPPFLLPFLPQPFFLPSVSLQVLLECTYGPYHPQSPAFFFPG